MFFIKKNHSYDLYNILLKFSRNKFFYSEINLPDTYETRIYLMLLHFSIILKIFKIRKEKFDQKKYDFFFNSIENNLRELGFGDVSVNSKMKNLNNILYDILLKIEKNELSTSFKINEKIVFKYFENLKYSKNEKYMIFEGYFTKFFNYCFDIAAENMIKDLQNFKFIYGST